jgi:tetratricopeptide (TPR) repeat protein
LNPNNPIFYARVYELLLDRSIQKPQQAVSLLSEACRRFPDQPAMAERLAIALSQSKQHQEAMTVFEQTLLDAQQSQPALLEDGLFYFRYGVAAEQAGFYEKAAGLFQKTLKNSKDPDVIAETDNYLGYMWVEHNQHLDEAGTLIKRALDIHPENPAFLDSWGWYLYQTNHFDQALPELLKAVEKIETPDPTLFEHLADTYFKLNNTSDAIANWQKALALPSATDTDRERIQQKIAATSAK